MDLRSLRDPVGPLPPGVYWRRRLLALGLVLLLVVLLAWACGSGGGGSAKTAGTASPTPATPPTRTVAPTPRRTTAAAPPAACPASALQVTAATDAAEYPAGALPHLTLTVRNAGARACTVDFAPRQRRFTVLSGTDRLWTTADCPQSQMAAIVTLAAGGSRSSTLTWSRHRSVPGCANPGPAAQPGTYRFYAGLGALVSGPAVFRLTG